MESTLHGLSHSQVPSWSIWVLNLWESLYASGSFLSHPTTPQSCQSNPDMESGFLVLHWTLQPLPRWIECVWRDTNQSLGGGGLGIRDGEKTQYWDCLRISPWELERPLPASYWKNQNQALRETKHLVVWFLVNFFTQRSKSGYVIKWNLGYMLFIHHFLSQTQHRDFTQCCLLLF